MWYKNEEDARKGYETHIRRNEIKCIAEVELKTGETVCMLSLGDYKSLSFAFSQKPILEVKKLIRLIVDLSAERQAGRERKMTELFPGLKEIEAARDAEENNREKFNRMMESGSSVWRAKTVSPSSNELRAQYPAAAAYLEAESYTMSDNVDKYSAGARAIERLMAGEDYKIAINDMRRQWSKDASRAVENN